MPNLPHTLAFDNHILGIITKNRKIRCCTLNHFKLNSLNLAYTNKTHTTLYSYRRKYIYSHSRCAQFRTAPLRNLTYKDKYISDLPFNANQYSGHDEFCSTQILHLANHAQTESEKCRRAECRT